MWNLKYHTNEHIYETNSLRQREQTCGCQGGGCGGRMDWESEISRCKLLTYIVQINKVLLHSTGNYIQYPVINHNRNICITESLAQQELIL